MTGGACCARALSQTIDYLSGHVMSDELSMSVGGLPHMLSYPDFLAFIFGVLACLVSSQLKSDVQNFFLDILHVLAGTLLVFVFSIGLFFTQSANWKPSEMTTDVIRVVSFCLFTSRDVDGLLLDINHDVCFVFISTVTFLTSCKTWLCCGTQRKNCH